jgi:hypothetical protein
MSMSRDQMLRYLDDPSLLNERTVGELKEILDEYPYFQSAHLLYIRNLQSENNFRYSGQLKISATYANDRTILYHLLNEGLSKSIPEGERSVEINVASLPKEVSLIEFSDEATQYNDQTSENLRSVLSSADIGHFDLLNFELSDSAYSLEKIEDEKRQSPEESSENSGNQNAPRTKEKLSTQKDELINRFIKDNPAFSVKQPEQLSGSAERTGVEKENGAEKEEFITETLARIYMNQGLYQKAISAFEKLSLKYPEKSAYFARQIEEVTNLLNK